MGTFRILSINVSEKVGEKKKPVVSAELRARHGIVGDAHAGDGPRQVSLLADEDIASMRSPGVPLRPGDFAENLTTLGVDWSAMRPGTRFTVQDAILEITQIGKTCHGRCRVMEQVGDCIMPKRGAFAAVIRGGEISCESVGTYDI